jgi:hypothetical protein
MMLARVGEQTGLAAYAAVKRTALGMIRGNIGSLAHVLGQIKELRLGRVACFRPSVPRLLAALVGRDKFPRTRPQCQ